MAPEKKQENRLKILLVDHHLIMKIIVGFFKYEFLSLPDFSGFLPEDSQVLDVQYDYSRRCFAFIIYSETFDVVPIGMELPLIQADNYKTIRLPKENIT